MKRVVVTGLGSVTSLGNDTETMWEKLKQGESGVATLKENGFGKSSVKIGAEVKRFVPPKGFEDYDPLVQYAVSASREAVRDSGLDFEKQDMERIGCFVSSSKGGMVSLMRAFDSNGKGFVENYIPSSVSSSIADLFGVKGPCSSSSAACATGIMSVLSAVKSIEYGECDAALAGSSEESLVPLILSGFDSMGVLANDGGEPSKAMKPFSRDREGFVIGSGCGVVILEDRERALGRGAKIYGEILSIISGADAFHITGFDPSSESVEYAMNEALKKACILSSEIQYINAHGTATKMNDFLETMAIKKTFGNYADKISISSTKPATGHMLGAAGIIEAIITLLAISDSYVPPTLNLRNADPECDLDYTPNEGRNRRIENAMSLSFGFGGHIGVIILGRN